MKLVFACTHCALSYRAAYSIVYILKQAGNAYFEQQCELSAQLSLGYQCVALIVCNKMINFVFVCAQCA